MKQKYQLQALHASRHPATTSTEQQAEGTPRAGVGTDANKINIQSLRESKFQLCSL
jgi:hypothetical protein